jgi:DNA topoisomerase-1
VAWGKPVSKACPECNNPYLIEKFLKSGAFAQCPNAECKYKEALATEEVSA